MMTNTDELPKFEAELRSMRDRGRNPGVRCVRSGPGFVVTVDASGMIDVAHWTPIDHHDHHPDAINGLAPSSDVIPVDNTAPSSSSSAASSSEREITGLDDGGEAVLRRRPRDGNNGSVLEFRRVEPESFETVPRCGSGPVAITRSGGMVVSTVGGALAVQELDVHSALVRRTAVVPAHSSCITCLALADTEFMRDEEIVVTGGEDGLGMVWNISRISSRPTLSLRPSGIIRGHDSPLICAAISVPLRVTLTCSARKALVHTLDGPRSGAPSILRHMAIKDGFTSRCCALSCHGYLVITLEEEEEEETTQAHTLQNRNSIHNKTPVVVTIIHVCTVNGTHMATTSIPHRVNMVGFVGAGHNEIAVACEGSNDEPIARIEKRSVLDLSLVWSYQPKRSSITASRTTTPATTTRQRGGGGGRAIVDAVTSLDFLPSWDNPYGVLVTGDSSGTVSLHTLPKYDVFIRETKAHDHRFDIGELGHKVGHKVAEGTREMRRQITTRAVQAKDLAVEALDEAKVLVDDVKNLPVIKGIVGFFSR